MGAKSASPPHAGPRHEPASRCILSPPLPCSTLTEASQEGPLLWVAEELAQPLAERLRHHFASKSLIGACGAAGRPAPGPPLCAPGCRSAELAPPVASSRPFPALMTAAVSDSSAGGLPTDRADRPEWLFATALKAAQQCCPLAQELQPCVGEPAGLPGQNDDCA